jgi:fructokinase
VIVVLGEALMDRIVAQDGSERTAPGGAPFNAARTIGRLGRPVAFVGRLSTDLDGRMLRNALERDGVTTDRAPVTTATTTVATATLDDQGAATYRFEVAGTSVPGLTADEAERGLAGDPAIVHVGGLGLALEPMATAIERALARLPITTLLSLDVNARPAIVSDTAAHRARLDRILQRTDVAKASIDDLAYLHPGPEPMAAAEGLLVAGPKIVFVTDGPAAVRIVARTGRRTIQVPRVAVVDTVGAGDAFAGGFLAWWDRHGLGSGALGDLDLVARAVGFAIVVAGRTCERAGADPPSLAELGGFG